jgi:hypothetical protein
MIKLKKHEFIKRKKKIVNLGESLKLGLIFQIYNSWNPRLRFNQKA